MLPVIVALMVAGFAWPECPQHTHGPFRSVGECVGHERIVSWLAQPKLKDAATAYRNIDSLYPGQRSRAGGILKNPLENPANYVKGADPVWASVHHVEPQELIRLHLNGGRGVLIGSAVEDDVVRRQGEKPLPIEPMGTVSRSFG